MHHGSICSLILAFLCAPTLSWQLLIPRQRANHQHNYYGYRHKRKHAERQGATFSSHNTRNHCLWPWTSHDNAPRNICKFPTICPIIDIGICTRNLSMAVASILLALQLLCPPAPALAMMQDAENAENNASTGAGIMGTSIVFDNFDEIPPIEEAVMRGSASTVIKLRQVEAEHCKVQSKFGDVLEIDYVAKKLAPPATVYDASIFRGTGQPFKFVLGSGVMIPGVDQALYHMCPGEVRLVKVPPKLAVGLLDPPAKAPLEWKVELISIDGIIRQNNNNELTREDRNME